MMLMVSLRILVVGCSRCITLNLRIDMKNLKIWSLAMMFILALTSCEKTPDVDGPAPIPGDLGAIVDEWALSTWSNAEVAFNVYIDFNDDGTFSMYQQIYSLDYVLFEGTYSLSGDVLTGKYSDGQAWACGYKVDIAGQSDGSKVMTFWSQDGNNISSVYSNTTIPEDIKAEAAQTRAEEVVRFL